MRCSSSSRCGAAGAGRFPLGPVRLRRLPLGSAGFRWVPLDPAGLGVRFRWIRRARVCGCAGLAGRAARVRECAERAGRAARGFLGFLGFPGPLSAFGVVSSVVIWRCQLHLAMLRGSRRSVSAVLSPSGYAEGP